MSSAFKTLSLTVLISCLLAVGAARASKTSPLSPDYTQLLDYIAFQDLQDPLVVFGEAEAEFDRQLNQENIDYLNGNKVLLQGLQARLNSNSLNWRLGASFKQLLVVPENRPDYAHLFERYCREAVDFLLMRVQMPNPYEAITTFQATTGGLPLAQGKGITAYLVHNIANEYIEEYLFFNQADVPDKIRIKLSNREFSGTIGSYTSRLKIGEDSQFEFVREPYTLWQNSADIPYNVLIVPVEETLHILLRPYTESAMQAELVKTRPTALDQVQAIVDHWMAVEESIVGGVVQLIMPDLVGQLLDDGGRSQLADAMAARDVHSQYVYIEKGIQVVDQLGVEAAMSLYRQSPEEFRQLVVDQLTPAAAAEQVRKPLSVN